MDDVLLFDDRVPAPPPDDALAAVADLRCTFDVRTGALTTRERMVRMLARAGVENVRIHVPEALAGLAQDSDPQPPEPTGTVLCISGRCVLPFHGLADLELGTIVEDERTGQVAAAMLDATDAIALVRAGALPTEARRERRPLHLLDRPWDVIRFRDAALDVDLKLLLDRPTTEVPEGVVAIADELCRFSPEALVYPSVVVDASRGPVVIEDDVTIRPGAILTGPVYVGPGSTILDGARIKPGTAIGPVCKVAGEVGGTIFQGYANKAHDGHLGDAWIGAWANLGAGTINSNLLNTYGEVKAQAVVAGRRESTGLRFFGCIVGDAVRTAIGTRIMTGCVLSTGAMVATTKPPPLCTERFAWRTDERHDRYDLPRFLATLRVVMERRSMELPEPLAARLATLHAMDEG